MKRQFEDDTDSAKAGKDGRKTVVDGGEKQEAAKGSTMGWSDHGRTTDGCAAKRYKQQQQIGAQKKIRIRKRKKISTTWVRRIKTMISYMD